MRVCLAGFVQNRAVKLSKTHTKSTCKNWRFVLYHFIHILCSCLQENHRRKF